MARARRGRGHRPDRPGLGARPHRRGARLRRRPAAAVRAASGIDLLQRRQERQAALDAGERPDFLAGDRARSARRLDRGAGAGRLRRPAGRDHRSGRGQDDDQRPQLGRPGLHGRPRGRAVADLGERRRWPGGADRRRPGHAHLRVARGQVVPARRAGRAARRPAARLAPHRVARHGRWRADLGVAVRCRAVPVPQRRRAGRPRVRAVPLPGQARVAPRGAALERRSSSTPRSALGVPRGSRPGDRAHRDDHRRVRDGRDPVRAARARRRASTPAAGTTCSARSRSSGRRRI